MTLNHEQSSLKSTKYRVPATDGVLMGPHRSKWIRSPGVVDRDLCSSVGKDALVCFPLVQLVQKGLSLLLKIRSVTTPYDTIFNMAVWLR